MPDYRDAGSSLLQSGDVPFVNQYGSKSVADRPNNIIAPTGGSTGGGGTPGGGGVPILTLSAYTLNFASRTGGPNPPTQQIEITNTGTGTIDFTVVNVPGWLNITPLSGAAPSTLTVTVLNSGLAAGWYGANVTINAPGATGGPAEISIQLLVEEAASLPTIDRIYKTAWLGYFKTVAIMGGPISQKTTEACTGTANCCVVLKDGDFGDPSLVDWATMQRTASEQIAALGGKIFIGATEAEIMNMKPYWDRVAGIYLAIEEERSYSTFQERVYAVERRIRDMRAIIWREQLANRPFLVYHTQPDMASMTYWLDGMDYLGMESYLNYVAGESSASVRTRMNTEMQGHIAKIVPMMKDGGNIMIIGQAYDMGTWESPAAFDGLQLAYADTLRAYSQVNGIIWFAYQRYPTGGVTTYPTYLIPWHKATYQAINGVPAVTVPKFRAYGILETCTTSIISGWAFDPDNKDKSIQVQIFNGPRTRIDNSNRVGQLQANIPRSDIVSITRDAGVHGFSMPTPAVLLDGATHNVWVYGIRYGDPTAYAQSQVPLVNAPGSIKGTGGTPSGTGFSTVGRSFYYNGSLYLWREASQFMAIKILLNGGSMDAKLDYWKNLGVNIIRVFGMISNADTWAGWAFSPQSAGYYDAWRALLSAAASRSMNIEACVFADASAISPYHLQSSRKQLIREFASTLASYKNFTIEVCNEPDHPYNGAISKTELVELANEVKSVDPNRVVTLGSSPGGLPDTSFIVPPANYAVVHSERNRSWDRIVSLFNPTHGTTSQSTMPLLDNEPINSTSDTVSDQINGVDPEPARWYAYGLGAQLRQISTAFHYGGGKYTDYPNPADSACITRWMQGLNDVSWTWGGSYFHGFYPDVAGSPFYRVGSELLCMGRTNAGNVVGMVIAPPGWTPSIRPGWTYNTPRVVTDGFDEYAAYYFTATYP